MCQEPVLILSGNVHLSVSVDLVVMFSYQCVSNLKLNSTKRSLCHSTFYYITYSNGKLFASPVNSFIWFFCFLVSFWIVRLDLRREGNLSFLIKRKLLPWSSSDQAKNNALDRYFVFNKIYSSIAIRSMLLLNCETIHLKLMIFLCIRTNVNRWLHYFQYLSIYSKVNLPNSIK